MTFRQLEIYFHTLRYMKMKQIAYRAWYMLRNRVRMKTGFRYTMSINSIHQELRLIPSIPASASFRSDGTAKSFSFLNLSHTFAGRIDWNYSDLGKLWTYNLNYFDYLMQPDMTREQGIGLIYAYIADIRLAKDGLEPFPIALRGINWIKFLSQYQIQDKTIDDALLAQYYILLDNLEYHLLGNHLLENGFSLLFGAFYFGDEKLFLKAKEILEEELTEQILPDGAHFELTPMYHQIMLFRVLDCYNLMQHSRLFEDCRLEDLLKEKASIMLGWQKNISFRDGSIPHLNDSAEGIAPTTSALQEYAANLGIETLHRPLQESGYRRFMGERYEMIVDVGNIGPDYIPGHAHSDTFNFVLSVDAKPLIVDTGISTYENNARRHYERSTAAHNTVEVNGLDQSEVWSSFRVARRAKITEIVETEESVRATHDGYQRIGILHTRQFKSFESGIEIKDILFSRDTERCEAVAFLHFAPGTEPRLENGGKILTDQAIFSFEGIKSVEIVDITIAEGYNRLVESKAAKLFFQKELLTTIEIVS